MGYIRKVLDGCKFNWIRDVSAARVSRWLADLRSTGRSVRTSNAYLIAIKGFTRWLVRERRAKDDVLSHLSRLNTETDVRRKRRVLTSEELELLIAAAGASKGRLGRMRGADRAIVYRLAAFTGLRAQEIASLTPRSFDLDANPPTVTVDACYSKHRRKDVLPLAEDLRRRLRAYLANRENERRGGDERLWPGKWYRKAGEILQRDLGRRGKRGLTKPRIESYARNATRATTCGTLTRAGKWSTFIRYDMGSSRTWLWPTCRRRSPRRWPAIRRSR